MSTRHSRPSASSWSLRCALAALAIFRTSAQPIFSITEIMFAPSLTASNLDGTPVRLEVTVHRPDGPGPFPLLVFNHGFDRLLSSQAVAARTAVELLWSGSSSWRGASRWPSRCAAGAAIRRVCTTRASSMATMSATQRSRRKASRARWRTSNSAVQYLRAQSWVDRDHVLVGGLSRGGILSVAYLARYPGRVNAAINFVGGWNGERCARTTASTQRPSLLPALRCGRRPYGYTARRMPSTRSHTVVPTSMRFVQQAVRANSMFLQHPRPAAGMKSSTAPPCGRPRWTPFSRGSAWARLLARRGRIEGAKTAREAAPESGFRLLGIELGPCPSILRGAAPRGSGRGVLVGSKELATEPLILSRAPPSS